MQEIFVQIIFGWPFMILSLLLAVAGILMKRPVFLIAGGRLSMQAKSGTEEVIQWLLSMLK